MRQWEKQTSENGRNDEDKRVFNWWPLAEVNSKPTKYHDGQQHPEGELRKRIGHCTRNNGTNWYKPQHHDQRQPFLGFCLRHGEVDPVDWTANKTGFRDEQAITNDWIVSFRLVRTPRPW